MGGAHENRYRKGDCLKRGGLDSFQTEGGTWQEREGGVFWRGGLIPRCTLWYQTELITVESSIGITDHKSKSKFKSVEFISHIKTHCYIKKTCIFATSPCQSQNNWFILTAYALINWFILTSLENLLNFTGEGETSLCIWSVDEK